MEANKIDFAAIPQTAIKVITQPAAFFREMPKTGGFVEPLVFMVVMGVVSGIIGGLLTAVLSMLGLHFGAGMVAGFVAIVMMPIFYAIGSAVFGFVAAAILFIIWKILGSNEEYETAYRCTAYMAAVSPITTVVSLIPYIGGAIAIVISLYYLVNASVEAHGIPSKKAWTVFGVIAAIFIVIGVFSQIAARRAMHNMEEMTENWKKTSEQMQKSAEEMQKQMQKDLEKNK
jgi:hypothetical protein